MNRQRELAYAPDDPVVVSGVGMVTPLGSTAAVTWDRVLQGGSAARRLSAALLLDDETGSGLDQSSWIVCPAAIQRAPGSDPVVALALAATAEALDDACLDLELLDPSRVGCAFGTSKGSLFAASTVWAQQRPQSHSAGIRELLLGPAVASTRLAERWQFCGPLLSPVAACATGLVAVIQAAQLVRSGACDVALAGSADDSLHPLVLASFQRLGVLAQHPQPQHASRPFDVRRTGFVVGAGAGSLLLERRSHARARGVNWYAELGPAGFLTDPSGMTAIDASGESLSHLVRMCALLDDSGMPRIPDVINLHGTGTRLNDPAECAVIVRVYEERIAETSCGSLKGGLGHLLGAAGSVELGLCCLMLRDQTVPPNVNLEEVDPACQLRWVRHHAETRRIESLLKTSLGFGGHQAGLWLKRGNRTKTQPKAAATRARKQAERSVPSPD